jgi:hypothetical protein
MTNGRVEYASFVVRQQSHSACGHAKVHRLGPIAKGLLNALH